MKKLLIETNPELINEWHPTRNEQIRFEEVESTSSNKAWWRCMNNPNHEWETRIYFRAIKKVGCPYCSGRFISFERSLAARYPEIANEWHPTKNGTLRPDQVGTTSSKRVWWICNAGHEWENDVRNRTAYGKKCRECHAITHSLQHTHAELVTEWHPTKNLPLLPKDVSHGSGRLIWWSCNQGHEWQAKVSYRVHGNKCPECPKPIRTDANSFVFISDSAPELAKEWHPTLNLPLLPEAVKPGSTKVKIWWICSKNPEHVWQSTPSNRTKGRGCPHCARGASLAVKYPEIAKEWHPSKNGDLKPSDLSYGSAQRAWWQCTINPKHEWESSVTNRTTQGGVKKCPFCVGKVVTPETNLAICHPDIAKEWHPTKNGELTAADVTRASGKKVWWLCSQKPDHEWLAQVKNRTVLTSGCPLCEEDNKTRRHYDLLYESAQTNADFLNTFSKSIETLRNLSKQNFPRHLHLQQPFFRMIYASIITAMETYLCDSFFHKVTNDDKLTEKLLMNSPDFKDKKYAMAEVLDWKKNTKLRISEHLLDIVWHNLPKIQQMYRSVLDVKFPSNIEPIHRAVSIRHDLVHRNGRTKAGTYHVVKNKEIEGLIGNIEKLINDIDEQLKSEQKG